MTIDSLSAEASRATTALATPTLRLLNHGYAPIVLPVLRATFTDQRVGVGRAHTRIDAHLEDLDDQGHDVPTRDGERERASVLCNTWRNNGWIKRLPADDGDGEVYELTSHTLAAFGVVENLSEGQVLLGESRLTTILQTIRRWATEANPDTAQRIEVLDEQIAELQVERDRLAAGGQVRQATDEQMLSGYRDVRNLIQQLPHDFRHLEELIDRNRQEILQAFRAEDRPKGEVLGEYLERSRTILEGTEEGRAFEGAVRVMVDEARMTAVKKDLRVILEHEFSEGLTDQQRREFSRIDQVLRQGIDGVRRRYSKTAASLAEQLRTYDASRDRELDQVLREVQQEVGVWMQTARPRASVVAPVVPQRVDVKYVKDLYDFGADRRPPALADVSAHSPAAVSAETLRAQGGPRLAEVRQALQGALDDGATDLVEAFNTLPPDLRRPVEVLGLLRLAVESGTLTGAQPPTDEATTRRPDGTTRTFYLPHLPADGATLDPEGTTHGR